MANAEQWARFVEQYSARVLKPTFEDVAREIAYAFFFSIVVKTPVWEAKPDDPPGYPKHTGGRAKGSWQISFGSPSAAPYELRPGDQGAEASATNRARATLDANPGFASIWITTPLRYMRTLEFGGYPNPPAMGTGRTVGGFSTQAPNGMVRQSIEEVKPQIGSIVAAVIAASRLGR